MRWGSVVGVIVVSARRSGRAPRIKEDQFLRAVVELARWAKWRVHHQRPAMTKRGWRSAIQGDSGWPDLVLVRGGEIIVAELKSEKGLLSGYQERWLSDLQDAGIEIHVWRPKDMDAIKARLLGESARPRSASVMER